ncbi:MAG: hypothetical protein HQK93_05250 [Nitrospirae bacterium]|nr:hypothetical protein [Nitrospirota bacterium]
MNRRCSFLDPFTLVSNSDAHSLQKLGREATLFDTEISFQGIYNALKTRDGFAGTIEFFPQEGKYYFDGHRKCDICWNPVTTIDNNSICPKCGKPVTKGVMYRVTELADRTIEQGIKLSEDFYSITSLIDIISEITNKSPNSKTVQTEYLRLIESLGAELEILLNINLSDIKTVGGKELSEGIKRLRAGYVSIKEGFDGEFGEIKIKTKT